MFSKKQASREEILEALNTSARKLARRADAAAQRIARMEVPRRHKIQARQQADSLEGLVRGLGGLTRDVDGGIGVAENNGGNVGLAIDAIYFAGYLAGMHKVLDSED